MRLNAPGNPGRTAAGFGLVEVLVASVVLAVGLVGGLLALIGGVQAIRHALFASAAVRLAADLGERIRANPQAGDAYALPADRAQPSPANDCFAAHCDPAALAAVDLYAWQQSVQATLPGARTTVRVTVAGGVPRYTIALEWSDGGRAPRRHSSVVAP